MYELCGNHSVFGKTGFALGTGSIRGVKHASVLHAALDLEITIFEASGGSVGAFAAQSIGGSRTFEGARAAVSRYLDEFREIDRDPAILFPPFFSFGKHPARAIRYCRGLLSESRSSRYEGVLGSDRLFRLVRNLDPYRIVRPGGVRTHVRVSEDDGARSVHRVFSSDDSRFDPERGGNPQDYIRIGVASASIQGVFPPQELWGKRYSDGDSVEILRLIEAGCDTIIVSLCCPDPAVENVSRSTSTRFWNRFHEHYIGFQTEAKNNDTLAEANRIAEMLLRDYSRRVRIIPMYAEFPRALSQDACNLRNLYRFPSGALMEAYEMNYRSSYRFLERLLSS